MALFKKGDIIVGNKLNTYSTTKRGTKWRVHGYNILGKVIITWYEERELGTQASYDVEENKFNLYIPKSPTKPYYPSWF